MKPVEFKGNWWLSGNVSDKVGGVLRFEQPDFPRLELFGAFGSFGENRLQSHQFIHGLSTSGKRITLETARENGFRLYDGAISSSHIGSKIYIGDHFESETDIRFKKARINFTRLYDWMGIKTITPEFEAGNRVKFYYDSPEKRIQKTRIQNALIGFQFGLDTKNEGTGVSLYERRWVTVETDELQTLDGFLAQYVSPLQSLMNVATANPNFVEQLTLIWPDRESEVVEVLYPQKSYWPINTKPLWPHRMLFGFGSIFSDLDKYLGALFKNSSELQEVFDLYRIALASPNLFLHLRFLTIIQSLEAYHRLRKEQVQKPPGKYAERVREILKTVNAEHKDWVEKRLKWRKRKILRQRLADLLSETRTVMSQIVVDLEELQDLAVNTRNYFAHFSRDLKDTAADGIELHWLTERLTILLQACLLNELEFNNDEIYAMFEANEHYRNLKTLLV